MEAALGAMIERGPALTLADVGEKVGLSAATIVQRFGSKRQLLLTVVRDWARQVGAPVQRDGSPLECAIGRMTELLALIPTPESIANIHAHMNLDLADPEFRTLIIEGYAAQRRIISSLLDEAIEAGEITHCDTERVALLMEVARHGSMQIWAFEPVGELTEWVTSCLEATLVPWRVSDSDDYLQVDRDAAGGVARRT
jgi:AcrR family transcriptional regulator